MVLRNRLQVKNLVVNSKQCWTGETNNQPNLLIADLLPYSVRPEGIDLIWVNGECRILFVEDRYQATGYATRNAVHWPIDILGQIP